MTIFRGLFDGKGIFGGRSKYKDVSSFNENDVFRGFFGGKSASGSSFDGKSTSEGFSKGKMRLWRLSR